MVRKLITYHVKCLVLLCIMKFYEDVFDFTSFTGETKIDKFS